jgi:DNA repair photolyase
MRSVDNPPNPWHATHIDWEGDAPAMKLEVFEERAKSILAENDSPDVPHRWSVNPYRGCMHACSYCYAHPSHQHLGFGAGTDFDRKIVVKLNAPDLLRQAFEKKSWAGETVMLSGNTDCYQPIEGTYQLTRACLEVFAAYRNPVAIVTKGSLVRRDLDILSRLAADGCALVLVSVPFADDATRKKVEPWASSVEQRFETLRMLSEAGVPTGVMVAPVIPGLNDDDVAEIVTRAHAAGARRAAMQLLRLPAEVMTVFDGRMREAFPDRVKRMESALVQVRRGKRNDSEFGARMTGSGPRWEIVRQLFTTTCKRLGMNEAPRAEPRPFRRPTRQGSLFEE